MKNHDVILVTRNTFVEHEEIDGWLVAYLVVDGRRVDHRVVARVADKQQVSVWQQSELVVTAVFKALLATIAVIALLSGNPVMALLAASMLKILMGR